MVNGSYSHRSFVLYFMAPRYGICCNDDVMMQIWDTAGQERFRALRTPFYRGTDVCLLCYAVDDADSFRGLKQWREEFLHYADVNVEKFPFIVVGNKVSR